MMIQVVPLSQSPTSAAQGALAIEVLAKNKNLVKLMKTINHTRDFQLIEEERKRFKKWGGGCHQKMGVSLKLSGGQVLCFEKGMDQKNSSIWKQNIIKTRFATMKKAVKEKDFVECHRELDKSVDDLRPYKAKKNEALIVTKGNLLDVSSSREVTVWTSGVETWRQLAAQGFWVLGSYDSMGELQEPDVVSLIGKKPLWKKLSHEQGHAKPWAKLIRLYTVSYASLEPILRNKGKTYFYWSHGELFEMCLKKFPWLKKKKHVCGLGSTLDTISSQIDSKNIIPVYNLKDWKKKWIL